MADGRGLESLFRQKLDRALFTSYFVGAVLPLAVFAGLIHFAALESVEASGLTSRTVGLVSVGAGTLSLCGFLALRRLARVAVEQMDGDNAGLSQLLLTARVLAQSGHAEEIRLTTSDCALALVRASATFILEQPEKESEEPALVASSGPGAQELFAGLSDELIDLARGAWHQSGAAHMSFDRAGEPGSAKRGTAVALPIPADSTGSVLIAVRVGAEPMLFDARAIDSLDTLAGISAVSFDSADMQHTQRNFFAHVTDLLVLALDAHVDRRDGHAKHVAEYSHQLGRKLGLDEEQLRHLHFASLLHDLGMLKIPASKQRDPAHFRKHSSIGARMLSRIRLWRDAAPIVLHHHENFDGSGYPEGLVGDDIPIESRIILVCDAFDAMTRDDTHRRARPRHEAMQELRDGMGTQFDPEVVSAFLDLAQRGEIH